MTHSEAEDLSRRELIQRGAIGAGGLVVGSLAPHGRAAAQSVPDQSGTQDFSIVFDRIVHSVDTRITLISGYISVTSDTRIVVDEIALKSEDKGIPTRTDRLRFGDYVFATGKRQDDGSIVARNIWAGVLSFPVTIVEVGPTDLTLRIRGASTIVAPRSSDVCYREEFGTPTRGVPSSAFGREAIAVGILREGYEVLDLASLTTLSQPWDSGWS